MKALDEQAEERASKLEIRCKKFLEAMQEVCSVFPPLSFLAAVASLLSCRCRATLSLSFLRLTDLAPRLSPSCECIQSALMENHTRGWSW
jgi:hypothetical protein